jgi:hypothetical protein
MDIANLDFTTITGNECDFNIVNCGNLGATGPSNLNSITGTSLTINNDTVLNNLRLQTLNVNNTFNHAVVHDPTTTQIFYKDDYVDTTQTQTLINKTLTQPTISQINNGGLLTIPTGPGTIAKISDIPSPATYATLTGVQTLQNKTLIQPIISQILNGTGTLTLPSNTNATLATTNDLIGFVTQTGTATLINKTINTNGPNSILVNNVLITNLLNQDVRSTAAPLFTGLNLNNRSQVFTWSQVTSTNLSANVLTVPIPNNSAITIETMMTFYCTVGTNINKAGTRKRMNRVINVGGGLSTSANIENLSSNDGGLNSIVVQYVASGVNSIVQIIGQLGDTITCTGVTTVYYI